MIVNNKRLEKQADKEIRRELKFEKENESGPEINYLIKAPVEISHISRT